MREDPIISGGWIKAALVLLVAAALGVGAYVLVSGVDINLPDLPDLGTNSTQTTLGDTTISQPETAKTVQAQKAKPPPAAPSAGPTIQQLQALNRCTAAANGDIDKITACFDRFQQRPIASSRRAARRAPRCCGKRLARPSSAASLRSGPG